MSSVRPKKPKQVVRLTFTSRASTAALEAAKPQVRVFWLPRYTSETLNWIEGFWEELKSTYFSRMLTTDRDSFYGAAVHLLRRVRSRSKLPTRAASPLNGISWDGLVSGRWRVSAGSGGASGAR
ncbi:MAG TPA: hypothetical protein VE153_13355 [Myxococcus sp.]|nr:hypothetical protein [Myxococcus sp.]